MSGPLAGIRVLEFSQVIAAPFAGQLLADLGAHVIKVEPPEGESWRWQANFAPGESKSFQTLNRGKRAMTLALDRPEAQAVVHALVPSIDVVLINYRPDVPAKFRIDYDTLRALKPDLVYADLTAFGRRGPWALRPGYDGVVQAVSGLMAGEGKLRPDGSPSTIVTTAIADYGTGMVLADAIVTALVHRERTGEGQFVACSLLATALNLQGDDVMECPERDAARNAARAARAAAQAAGAGYDALIAMRAAERRSSESVFERCWLVADGAVAVDAHTPAMRAALLRRVGVPEDASDRCAISPWFASRTSAQALAALAAAGVPAIDVRFGEEAGSDPQVSANGFVEPLVHETTGPQTTIARLLRFGAAPCASLRPSPPIGRDTDAILAELGYDADGIAMLREQGVTARVPR